LQGGAIAWGVADFEVRGDVARRCRPFLAKDLLPAFKTR